MEKKPRIFLWFSFLFIINFGWISRIIQDQTERMLGKEMNPKIFLWSYIDKVHYSGIKYCIQIVLYIKKKNTCVGLCTRNKMEYVFQKGSKKTFTPSANFSCIYFHWKHRLCHIRVHMDDWLYLYVRIVHLLCNVLSIHSCANWGVVYNLSRKRTS
jgi:hypothetical protein